MLTWGEGGVDEKITDYVDMGEGLQKFDSFYVKSDICFTLSDKMFKFLIYLYMSTILHHYILKNVPDGEIYYAERAKK